MRLINSWIEGWIMHRHFAELRCKACGGWCKWKGSGWRCGVCGKKYDL